MSQTRFDNLKKEWESYASEEHICFWHYDAWHLAKFEPNPVQEMMDHQFYWNKCTKERESGWRNFEKNSKPLGLEKNVIDHLILPCMKEGVPCKYF